MFQNAISRVFITIIITVGLMGTTLSAHDSQADGSNVPALNDHLGSAVAIVDAYGVLDNNYKYRPFGQIFASVVSGPDNHYGFTGKELDQELGLDLNYFGARYYDPAMRRFVSVDPLSAKYPGWSPYTYTLDNPIKYIDPDGAYAETVFDLGAASASYLEFIDDPGILTGIALGLDVAALLIPAVPAVGGMAVRGAARWLQGASKIPLGFSDAKHFADFTSALKSGLSKAGYEDVGIALRGNSVTGVSYKSGKAFDAGRLSDLDFALASPELLELAKKKGISLRGTGTRTAPLNPAHLESLGLTKLSSELSDLVGGRDVSFMIYESMDAVAQRGTPFLRIVE